MANKLEGSLLEVCDCEILYPCSVGEAPDNGTCQTVLGAELLLAAIGVGFAGATA